MLTPNNCPIRIFHWHSIFCLLLLVGAWSNSQAEGLDPAVTVTVFVHVFSPDGFEQSGIFGEDHAQNLHIVSDLLGLPTVEDPDGDRQTNVVGATTYYGNQSPYYYSIEDEAELASITSQWEGGIPRYALIVAKYVRELMRRSGADRVNLVSASMGSLVTRWLIEKDLEGLASDGKIGRWLSLEGVVAGNWAASLEQDQVFELYGTPTIDLQHMRYSWIEENLHSPRKTATSPYYKNILLGHVSTTNDDLNFGLLTGIMLLNNQFLANDGVVTVVDSQFEDLAVESRFRDRMPTQSYFDVTHQGLINHLPAHAQVATFMSSQRRVTITLDKARITNLHEPHEAPAEIVFSSSVNSPEVERRWGITGKISEQTLAGHHSPVWSVDQADQEFSPQLILFDDFILNTETILNLEIQVTELDWDDKYGIFELIETASGGDLSILSDIEVSIDVSKDGSYILNTEDWRAELTVQIDSYPIFPKLRACGKFQIRSDAEPRELIPAICKDDNSRIIKSDYY